MTDADMVGHVSGYTRVPLHDFERTSGGLLVASGSGLMLAVMDACPRFRWCVDLDVLDDRARWEEWLLLVRAFVRPMGIVGWFSITRPQRLAAAVQRLRPAPGLYAAGLLPPDPFEASELRFETLEEFLRWASQAELPPMRNRPVELTRVGETPAQRTVEPPTAVLRDDVGERHDAHYDATRQTPDVFGGHGAERSWLSRSRMNGDPSAVRRRPRPVLDVLDAAHDQRRPRLTDGKDAHE